MLEIYENIILEILADFSSGVKELSGHYAFNYDDGGWLHNG